jgi:NAD(P)H dehydrogenase (quinone)
MIVVTGANGQLGRGIIGHLLKLAPAEQIAASVRDPGKAQDLAKRGVRVRYGDFGDPASLAAAFEGAERVLIMSTTPAPGPVERHRAALEAARAAGAKQIVYVSFIDRDPASPFHAAAAHAETETLIRASGTPYTFLENDLYADGLPMMLAQGLQSGVIEAPADGPVAWAVRDDLAEAAARILAEGSHVNEALPLTGPQALDLAGLAAVAGKVLGRPIERRVVPDELFIERMAAMMAAGGPPGRPGGPAGSPPGGPGGGAPAGGPPPDMTVMARGFLGMYLAMRQGRFAGVSPLLRQVLGRAPRSIEDFLRQSLASH